MSKYSVVLLVAVVVVVGVFPSFSWADPKARSSAVSIKVGDNFFVRKSGVPTVTVRRGTVVRWVWAGRKPHNLAVTRGPARFSSPVRIKGSFQRKLTRRGTYTVVCPLHGAADMSMKLRVR